jgi:hypothetical protein
VRTAPVCRRPLVVPVVLVLLAGVVAYLAEVRAIPVSDVDGDELLPVSLVRQGFDELDVDELRQRHGLVELERRVPAPDGARSGSDIGRHGVAASYAAAGAPRAVVSARRA